MDDMDCVWWGSEMRKKVSKKTNAKLVGKKTYKKPTKIHKKPTKNSFYRLYLDPTPQWQKALPNRRPHCDALMTGTKAERTGNRPEPSVWAGTQGE